MQFLLLLHCRRGLSKSAAKLPGCQSRHCSDSAAALYNVSGDADVSRARACSAWQLLYLYFTCVMERGSRWVLDSAEVSSCRSVGFVCVMDSRCVGHCLVLLASAWLDCCPSHVPSSL